MKHEIAFTPGCSELQVQGVAPAEDHPMQRTRALHFKSAVTFDNLASAAAAY
jgi:hypothetical protein